MTYLLQPEPWVLDGMKHERYKGMYIQLICMCKYIYIYITMCIHIMLMHVYMGHM